MNSENLIFFFENACKRGNSNIDEFFINKVKTFLQQLSPSKIWEETGVRNKNLHANVFPDFVIYLNNKFIACEIELSGLAKKYQLYEGLDIFDEIWFFTEIQIEKKHLHYKFENNLKIPQKFFGRNDKGEIVKISEK